ncbi:hypothetical protein NAI64_05660 [Oxalobacter sp. OxGP1]|uniref:hypothetical protein n=1 Tax=Oxalobacter paeniformigenes TaxID=2946594 RepID=UPI0022B03843|nr:hypothetical protein [Oxalobacter paeniformigenes]MCZ4053211.1 hypothetical protein [Oxalobacter paeniformigenes]
MTEQQFSFYSLNAMAQQMDVMARNGVNIAWLYESCRDVYAEVPVRRKRTETRLNHHHRGLK